MVASEKVPDTALLITRDVVTDSTGFPRTGLRIDSMKRLAYKLEQIGEVPRCESLFQSIRH